MKSLNVYLDNKGIKMPERAARDKESSAMVQQ